MVYPWFWATSNASSQQWPESQELCLDSVYHTTKILTSESACIQVSIANFTSWAKASSNANVTLKNRKKINEHFKMFSTRSFITDSKAMQSNSVYSNVPCDTC